MQPEWENPIWHYVGLLGVIGFSILVALVLVGRVWFKGRNEKRTRIAVELLGNIGGSRVAREAQLEFSKRFHTEA